MFSLGYTHAETANPLPLSALPFTLDPTLTCCFEADANNKDCPYLAIDEYVGSFFNIPLFPLAKSLALLPIFYFAKRLLL